MRILVAILAALLVACGAQSNSSYSYRTAPNPNGCYAEVFAQEQFRGARDFINGPNRYARVSAFRRDDTWQGNGIRSIKTGPAGTVTIWSEQAYRGTLLRLGPGQNVPRLDDVLSGKGVSVEIACTRVAAE